MTAGSLLFAYGTLQDPAVQTAVFGRDLGPGAPDRLSGFRLSHIPVDDLQVTAETGLTHYPILIPTPDAAPPGSAVAAPAARAPQRAPTHLSAPAWLASPA